jgi:SAM-dependent methyltransferase
MDERISLERWCPPWVRHQHLARYWWACGFAAGKRVLDAACGTGYGSVMLATNGRATHVDGIDIASDAIAAAEHHASCDRVRFQTGDVTRLPVADGAYDLYVSFETIEHLPNDQVYVTEAARVLHTDGMFLCSTPNRRFFHPGATLADRPLNPFHVREYERAELAALLGRHFGRIEWFGQTPLAAGYERLLAACGRTSSTLTMRLHQAFKLATLSFAGEARHAPQPLADRESFELLVAVCTQPRRPGA